MQKLTTLDYLKISLANALGLDKVSWEDRVSFVDAAFSGGKNIDELLKDADEPMLARKAVRALGEYHTRTPSGYMMSMDATASGLQIMAILFGCEETARKVNLINTGFRENAYQHIADAMEAPVSVVKKPVMTHYYGSKEQPKSVFGEGEELNKFYSVLESEFPGAELAMECMLDLWRPNAEEHVWTLPDGHTAVCKVSQMVSHKIPIRGIDGAEFGYRAEQIQPQRSGISLPANIVHSIDGYIVREMIRRAHAQKFELLTIHDSFWARPQHMSKVRKNYMDIMRELADMDLLQSIGREILGHNRYHIKKINSNLADMLDGEYALS